MKKLSITEAREKLPQLMNNVYFNSETFLITKRGIPMAKITRADQLTRIEKYSKKDKINSVKEAAGIWKNRWKGKSTEEVAEILRKKSWYTHAS